MAGPDLGTCACGVPAEVVVPEAHSERMCYACRDGFLYYEQKRQDPVELTEDDYRIIRRAEQGWAE